jgi:hypothetical protein
MMRLIFRALRFLVSLQLPVLMLALGLPHRLVARADALLGMAHIDLPLLLLL